MTLASKERLMKATMTILLFVAACGGSKGPTANTSLRPGGQGWFCTVGTQDPNYFSFCARDTAACEAHVTGGAPGAFQPCAPAATATCLTYTARKAEVECFANAASCKVTRDEKASRPLVNSAVSSCDVWD
jgi:hypothetical protein